MSRAPPPITRGYQGFGSFHSANVQELIARSAEPAPPALPITLPRFARDDFPAFGAAMRAMWLFPPEWCFVNHGAFGAAPHCILDVAEMWRRHMETQPLRFIDRQLLPLLVLCQQKMASFVGADPRDVVFVPNVTHGMNTVVAHVLRTAADAPDSARRIKVYALSTSYGATKKLLKSLLPQVELVQPRVVFPVTADSLVQLVKDTLPHDATLAVFEHIPSNTPFVFPVAEVAQHCRELGVQVLVDGAHALLTLPLHIDTLGVDYYVTNCHKWFCSPKGCALLWSSHVPTTPPSTHFFHSTCPLFIGWVRRERQVGLRPLVVSHGFGHGFTSDFIWNGLDDPAPMLTTLSLLDFWNALGLDAVRDYCRGLLQRATSRLVEVFHPGAATPPAGELLLPLQGDSFMNLVLLPPPLHRPPDLTLWAKLIQDALFDGFVECPTKVVQGRLYLRISCFVYNCDEDYERVGCAVLALAEAARDPTHPLFVNCADDADGGAAMMEEAACDI